MTVSEKLGEMAKYATEVQELMDKQVELVEFTKKEENGKTTVFATAKTGTSLLPHPSKVDQVNEGGWWFVHLVKENGQVFGMPLAKFSPDLYFEAKPVERLWVERTFEREQKEFTTQEAEDVIEWTPITREVTVRPDGSVALGEFAQYFGTGLAFANIGKAKGEGAPLLGIAPTDSKNAFKVDKDTLRVPRLQRVLNVSQEASFAAEWNDERKMLIVYLEGVNPQIKM